MAEKICRVARTRGELEAALSLVYKEYLRRGYVPKGYKSEMRIGLHNALPSTTTFVTMDEERVLAGLTLIPDSPLGIPMDKIYQQEVDAIRARGGKVAEASQLAIDSSLFTPGMYSMFNFDKLIFLFRFFKVLLDYAKDVDGVTDLCIAVNPKQQNLYRFLFFEQIGDLKHYGSVNKAPALAFHLNLPEMMVKLTARRALHKIFFGAPTPAEHFAGKLVMTADDLDYFFVQKSEVFRSATPPQLKVITEAWGQERMAPALMNLSFPA